MFHQCKEKNTDAVSAAASNKACPRCSAVIRNGCTSGGADAATDKERDGSSNTYNINMRDGRVCTYSIQTDDNGGGSSFNMVQVEDVGRCRNRVTCAACGCRFCWLCVRELPGGRSAVWHFWSPSTGCAPRGETVWSRRKKVLWTLGSVLGSLPAGAVLASALTYIAIPHLVVAGAPLWAVIVVAATLGGAVGLAGLYIRHRMSRIR